VRRLLDIYYDVTTDIVLGHGGAVMQFVGDKVFAVFGAPLPDPNPAYGAYRYALDIVNFFPLLDQRLGVIGDTVNVRFSALLSSSREPGRVLGGGARPPGRDGGLRAARRGASQGRQPEHQHLPGRRPRSAAARLRTPTAEE
jgi:hypothetical protein